MRETKIRVTQDHRPRNAGRLEKLEEVKNLS